eukprot:470870-Pelagomonas_calceolata.AAC.1
MLPLLQVKGKGAGQMNAEGAYSCQQGHRARELWPRDIALPPQYCAGCRDQWTSWLSSLKQWKYKTGRVGNVPRILPSVITTSSFRHVHAIGQHDPAKERNPAWEPYTPAARLKGLNLLGTRFTWALERRQLCVTLNDGSRVKPVCERGGGGRGGC